MALGRNLSTVNVDEFAGGCNYSRDMSSIAINESPNSLNVIFDLESIYKRTGHQQLGAQTESGTTCHSLFDLGVEGVGRQLVAHFGSKVYSMSNLNGVFSEILAGRPNVRSFNAEVKQRLVQTYNDYSTPYYWDGETDKMQILSSSAPGFKHVVEHQGYLLGGNTYGNKLRIYYEDVNTMVGGSYLNFFTIQGGKDDEVTAWITVNGRLYAGTKTGIHRVSFVGGVSVFEYRQVVSKTGIVPGTAQTVVTSQLGEVGMFLGFDMNVYAFDGTIVRNLSDKYDESNNDTEIALDQIERKYLDNIFAVYDPVRHIYRLSVTKKGDDENNFCLNIDTRNFAYYPFDNYTFQSGAVAENIIGRQFMIYGDYDGKIHKVLVNKNSDNGVVIREYYESPLLVKRVNAQSKSIGLGLLFAPVASYSLSCDDRSDFDKTWKSRASISMYSERDRFLGVNTNLGNTAYLGSEREDLYETVNLPVTQSAYRFRLRTGAVSGEVVSYTTGTVSGSGGGTSLTGSGTVWTSDMTSANGWKIVIYDGAHKNYIYNFDYVSSTSATVSTMTGTSPANDFSGASYEVYRSLYAPAMRGWELKKIDYDSQVLSVGKAEGRF